MNSKFECYDTFIHHYTMLQNVPVIVKQHVFRECLYLYKHGSLYKIKYTILGINMHIIFQKRIINLFRFRLKILCFHIFTIHAINYKKYSHKV